MTRRASWNPDHDRDLLGHRGDQGAMRGFARPAPRTPTGRTFGSSSCPEVSRPGPDNRVCIARAASATATCCG
jgi:hypothetical protein